MKQVRHQERAAEQPGTLGSGFKLDPARHYVRVEIETRKAESYSSPIDEMLDEGYRLESEDRSVTGHSRMRLLSIDKTAFEQRQKAFEDEARWHVRQPSANQEAGMWERTEIGSPLTIKQLERSIGKPTAVSEA